ncbi:MAG: PQQ-binding-like beta-propeller repeat protein [Kiritimatiellia bacterium]
MKSFVYFGICLATWLGLGCAGLWAQEARTNDQPQVADAVVEPDSDVNNWITRAAQTLRSGQPDAAIPWFQHLLRADAAALVSTNGTTFRPVRQVMAELLRELPERTLAAFRLRVEAPKMLPDRSPNPTDPASLEALYREEYPGIRNLDTGLRLAALYLDQERFQDARRVLMDLLDECLPTRPARAELLARLTVACARVGDTPRAARAWAELQKEGHAGRWPGLEAELHAKTDPAAASNAWAMAYGGPQREGSSRGTGPDLAVGELLAMRWGLNLGPGVIRGSRNVDGPTNLPPQLSIGRAYVVARMLEDNRRPADDIVFAGNRAWINGIGDLALIDLDSGRVMHRTQHIPDPPQDTGRGVSVTIGMANWNVWGFRGARGGSTGPAETWIFDSRLSRAATFNESRVYCVEDNIRASLDPNMRQGNVRVNNTWVMRPQLCGNALAAYDAATGKLLWRVGRELPPATQLAEEKPKDDKAWEVPFVDAISVDGKLDDWRGRGQDIPLAFFGASDQKWPGAAVKLGWNETGLLVRAEVTDRDIQEHDAEDDLWRGDSLEMFLADRRGGADSVQVAAGTGADPRYQEARLHIFDRRSTRGGRTSSPEAVVAGRPAANGYTFEALLPWSNLGIRPRAGNEVGFQIYVNNVGSNRADMAARFYPEGGTFSDTRKMYTIRLASPSGSVPPPSDLPARPKKETSWQVNAIRFAAAPVPCAGLLLAPVEEDNGLSVAGLEADTGAYVWRTRVVWRKPSAEPRSVTLTLTVDGADVYLCGESSWVSRMDGCDGSVRWTTLYEPLDTTFSTNAAGKETMLRNAWEEGLVLVAGDAVVALPEGSQEILALDRQSGTPLWRRRKPEGVNYVVGRQGSVLMVAGEKVAACLDLAAGRTIWRAPIEGSTGRGALCGQEVLIPNGQTILRLRAADGTALKPVRAQTPDNLPLGNLYVQGDQLLVAGLERLYALTPAAPAFARLNESLARNPSVNAYVERANLYANMQHPAEAVADLREAWKLEQKGTNRAESMRGTLLTALWRLAEKDSALADGLHAEALQVAATAAERTEATWRQAQCREKAGNTNGALGLYVAILSASDAVIPLVAGDADWEVSARLLAARRLDAMLADDMAKRRSLLDEPAAQALGRLGSKPSFTGLVEAATLFPGTTAGREAALKAAQAAADSNSLGMAEAILYRALTLSAPSDRTAAVDALLKLYERMKWLDGAVRLQVEWPQLFGEAVVPLPLERAAAAALSAAVPTPLPPWRLRWRKALGQGVQVRPLNAGLFYWNTSSKKTGCLALEDGLPRWEKTMTFTGAAGAGDDTESPVLVAIIIGNTNAYMDAWSGAITSYRPPIPGQPAWWGRSLAGRTGMALVGAQVPGGFLASFDMLTGQITWKRRELESLLSAGSFNVQPVFSTSRSATFMGYRQDGSWTVAELDLPTGAVVSRRTVDQGANPWGGRRAGKNATATEWSYPTLENERITVKNIRTGAVVWTSPTNLAIAKHQLLNNGSIFARTATNDLVLLNGRDGKLMRRWEGIQFDYLYAGEAYAGEAGDAVIAYKPLAGGTNEVLVLDPAASNVVFRGILSPQTTPVLSLGPNLPGQLLVKVSRNFTEKNNNFYRQCLQVVDEQGENPTGWRLPRKEDIRDESGSFQYQHFRMEGLILILDPKTGEVLAYEHDPGEGSRKP